MGWKDCTWNKSEGLIRQAGEFKEGFRNRVYQNTKNSYCGLNNPETIIGVFILK